MHSDAGKTPLILTTSFFIYIIMSMTGLMQVKEADKSKKKKEDDAVRRRRRKMMELQNTAKTTRGKRTVAGFCALLVLFLAISEGVLFLLHQISDPDFQTVISLAYFEESPGYTVDGRNPNENRGYLLVLLIGVLTASIVLAIECTQSAWRSGRTPWWIFLPIVTPHVVLFLFLLIRMVLALLGILLFLGVLFIHGLWHDSD